MKIKRFSTNNFRMFLICVFFSACLIIFFKTYMLFIVSRSDVANMELQVTTQNIQKIKKSNHNLYNNDQINFNLNRMKYILQWTSPTTFPFVDMGVGQSIFIKNKCRHVNCFVTSNKQLLRNITMFDVIVFAGTELEPAEEIILPQARSPHQKYVFANIESASNYPIFMRKFDGYFNWTWTYKLDSDSRWGYIVIRAANGTIVGPNKIMHWINRKDMRPVSKNLKEILRGKTRTAAWFVSNCHTLSLRGTYVKSLQVILYRTYNLSVDIYGKCGNLKCPRDNYQYCDEMIRSHYFFYLVFENAFSEDYVTEKLLRPLLYNAIPVVYGGANYSRFLPDGSYIDASKENVRVVAKKMYELINNFEEYVEYFKWNNHYTYHKRSASIDTDDFCSMCALLNDEKKVKEITVYKKLRKWWNEEFS